MEKPTKPAGKAFRQSKNMRTTRFCGFITMSDPPSNKKTALGNFPKAELRGARCALAEKEGFEPSMSYQPIHEFQSCAINRARRLLHSLLLLFHYSYNSIAQNKVLVNSGKHFFSLILLSYHAVLIIEPIIRANILRFVEKPVILILVKVYQAHILLIFLIVDIICAGITAPLYTLFVRLPIFQLHTSFSGTFTASSFQRSCLPFQHIQAP